MKYSKPTYPEWIQPIQHGYKMMCCDCGLVHTLNFRVIGVTKTKDCSVMKKPFHGLRFKVQFQCARNNRSSAQARRFQGITVKKVAK